jgi:hypothetical protein
MQERGSETMTAESKAQLQQHDGSREFITSHSLNEVIGKCFL